MTVLDLQSDLCTLFEEQARSTPSLLALEDATSTWTYASLEEATGVFGHTLQTQYKVARDELVGILMDRGAHNVIGSLAALRAGGAFLSLELAYPDALLGDVVEDARPRVILTQAAHKHRLTKLGINVPVIAIDQLSPDAFKGSARPAKSPKVGQEDDLDRLAFVSYSSGTTGKPKGIANPHRAAVGSYDLRFGLCNLQKGDRVAANVFFIWEMLRPLFRGATCVAVPDAASYDPELLVDFLTARSITDTLFTPTLLATVLARYPDLGEKLPTLTSIWLNGEVVPWDLCRRTLATLPNARLLNVYSACETHEVGAGDVGEMMKQMQIAFEVQENAADGSGNNGVCPVGPLLDPDNAYILDPDGKPVEQGGIGELCVGGPLLATRYLNLPDMTIKAFVQNPFAKPNSPFQRMYRTGDAARLVQPENGAGAPLLEVTGRIGGMIKTRGYTVQPGLVEAAIVAHMQVRACAVVGHGEGLEKRLVAYVVKDDSSKHEASQDGLKRTALNIHAAGYSPEARRALAGHLAHYMIPSVWIEMDVLPTHAVSGKIDLRALPKPPPTRPATPTTPTRPGTGEGSKLPSGAQTPSVKVTSEAIAEAWSASLGLPLDACNGPGHTFFDLGGHSLSLADLAGRLTRLFGFSVPVAPLAANPSIEGHMQTVVAARDGHLSALNADLPAMLRADSALDDEVRPTGPQFASLRQIKSDRVRNHAEPQSILLTGATGFLGAFLIRSLIEQRPNAKLLCLVRFPTPENGMQSAGLARIRSNLIDLGLWHDSLLDQIEVLPGNISKPLFGMDQVSFDKLAERTDAIVHAAATVNLVYPYAALREPNVQGTQEILRLASLGGASVIHISSNGALPPSSDGQKWREDATLALEKVHSEIPDGYGQTKWVAEQLAHQARARGLPVTIVRPGTLSGCSKSGASNQWDMLNAIIVEALRMKVAPIIEGWRTEMTPVDYVADAIAAIDVEFENVESSDALAPVLHLCNSDPPLAASVFDMLQRLGYSTEKRLEWEMWVSKWRAGATLLAARSNNSTNKLPFCTEILRGSLPTVDTLRLVPILDDSKSRGIFEKALGYEKPKIDEALWQTYTRHFYARGWLPHSPTRSGISTPSTGYQHVGRLAGKVAVVTGASSGIGAAVALALANEGASVSLAARRTSALQGVKARVESVGGKAVICQTDVTSNEQVKSLFEETKERLGEVDIVVSCAGVMYFTMMHNVQTQQWDQTVDVNCKGLLHVLGNIVPSMLSRKAGHIVAISSDAGRKVFPGLGVYSASKFFVEATLQSLRLETVGSGLKVTSVQPGNVATDLLGMSSDKEALEKYGTPTGAKVLDPKDVANSIVHALCQPEHVSVNEILVEPRDEPI
ncbi:putative NRPS-like enzyme [Ceraceosorus guamensis]|uniref:Putative NRPS-like enzyme n=1 Tax=Ceraceosorus guamensis TaxID=1522189 RepID=A0A316VP52_9BASI|nr:putative NRPS-like enzyme [Ceraceosorus guamensis]PWN39094.1 putative NRPS-like enzyme [Ceraceosorus guamensis]